MLLTPSLSHKLSHLLGPPPPRACRTLWTAPLPGTSCSCYSRPVVHEPGYMDSLVAWMSSNCLRRNPSKTQFMNCDWTHDKSSPRSTWVFLDTQFSFSTSVRDLGVTFN